MVSTIKPKWEHFAHEADIGVRGIGPSREQAFEQAAMALTAVITDPKTVKLDQRVNITCEAADDEMLLVNWLNSLLYEMAVRRMLFGRFEVFINNNRLSALAWGEKMDISRHSPAVEVKGATVTNLSVKQDRQKRWIAQCVVDV
jgi:tRNA nucleotidyltransferase (CCA-adding enzyme)